MVFASWDEVPEDIDNGYNHRVPKLDNRGITSTVRRAVS